MNTFTNTGRMAGRPGGGLPETQLIFIRCLLPPRGVEIFPLQGQGCTPFQGSLPGAACGKRGIRVPSSAHRRNSCGLDDHPLGGPYALHASIHVCRIRHRIYEEVCQVVSRWEKTCVL